MFILSPNFVLIVTFDLICSSTLIWSSIVPTISLAVYLTIIHMIVSCSSLDLVVALGLIPTPLYSLIIIIIITITHCFFTGPTLYPTYLLSLSIVFISYLLFFICSPLIDSNIYLVFILSYSFKDYLV